MSEMRNIDVKQSVSSLAHPDATIQILYQTHYSRTVQRCQKWLVFKEDAEDASQEVFLRVTRALPNFRNECRFETWLYLVTKNVCRNMNRGARRKKRALHSSFEDHYAGRVHTGDTGSPFPQAQTHCEVRQLMACVSDIYDTLSLQHQRLFDLKIIRGLTYEEVAHHLNIATGTVKSRLARLRIQLKSRHDLMIHLSNSP